MTKQNDLIAYLFEGVMQQYNAGHPLAHDLLEWMVASSRFTVFVDTYRDKIRKKIRINRESGSIQDLRSELAVAYCLLNDRHMSVAYEPYASTKMRGADFAVTYRVNLVFNIEVAHIRTAESAAPNRKEERILRILLDKLAQMQPGIANLLVIYANEDVLRAVDLNQLMQEIKTRAEKKDASFYALSRYAGPPAFYKDFLHLCGILLSASLTETSASQVWINKQARPGLPEKIIRQVSLALQSSPTAKP